MSDAVLSARHTVVFTGALGSGKTEVAISYARAALAQGRHVTLVDCDIVTPYFRVGDHRETLAAEGLRIVAAPGDLASFELPAVSPEFTGALTDPDAHLVLDVGGDPAGARFLAGYAEAIAARGFDMWLVVNPFRPAAAQPEAVVAQAGEIERQSKLRFTGLVANPNLAQATRVSDLQRGLAEIKKAAALLDLPVVLLAVASRLAATLPPSTLPRLVMRLTLRLPWAREGEQEEHPAKRT